MNAMTELKNLLLPTTTIDVLDKARYRQLEIQFNLETRSVWTYMKPTGTACFSLSLLNEFKSSDKVFQENGGKVMYDGELTPVDYFVVASKIDHIFNYGGDLATFIHLIKARDREALLHYARLCVDGIYARVSKFHSQAITVSLVQGDALGGGFELALTGNVIIAEESARMGFPEILFNLFPGMGAYSLLARRVGMKKAEEMILSGKIYDARELFEMGIVDYLVPNGDGERAVYAYILENKNRVNGMQAMYQCRNHTNPISYDELMKITEVWVDAAMRLKDRDFKLMGRLVRAQLKQQNLRKQGLPIEDDSNWAVGEA